MGTSCHSNPLEPFFRWCETRIDEGLFYVDQAVDFELCSKSLQNSSHHSGLTHCWNRRWQVCYDGYRSGSSTHGAHVRKTQKTLFRTARRSIYS
jgi:hypothetical protein